MGSGLYGFRGTVVPENTDQRMDLDPNGFIVWDWDDEGEVGPLVAMGPVEPKNDVELPTPHGFFRRALSEFREGVRYRLTLGKELCARMLAEQSVHNCSSASRIYLLESIEPSCLYLRDETRDNIYYIEYELLFGPEVTFTQSEYFFPNN